MGGGGSGGLRGERLGEFGGEGAAVGLRGSLWGRFGGTDTPPHSFLPHQELWASFRGRRMGGRELPLPHGYRGVLLREGDAPPSDDKDPQVRPPHTWGGVEYFPLRGSKPPCCSPKFLSLGQVVSAAPL